MKLLLVLVSALLLFFLFFLFFRIIRRTEGFTTQRRFHTSRGSVEVNLEVVQTAPEIQRGLMGRTSLPPNTGMLFQFPDEKLRSFWMQNTLIPLDMFFINSAGRIVNIVHSAPPLTETLQHSIEPAQYVVELAGGSAQALGIQAGDRFQ